MGFKKASAAATAEAPAPVTTPAAAPAEAPAPAPAADYPAPQPPEDKPAGDLRSLHSSSDKDLRMMFAGIYQAVLQSQALYAAKNVMDIATWHNAVEEEVDYFVRRVLERSQKE